MFLDVFTVIGFAWFLGAMTDAAVHQDLGHIGFLLPIGAGIISIKLAASYLDVYLEALATQSIKRDLKSDLLEHLLRIPIGAATRIHSGELISHFTNDVQGLDGVIGRNLINLVRMPLMSLAVFCYLVHINIELSLISLLLAPVALCCGSFFGLLLRRSSRAIYQLLGQTSSQLNDIFHGQMVIRSFLLEKLFFKRYNAQNNRLFQYERYNAKLRGVYNAGGQALGLIAFFGSLSIGALLVSRGQMTVGALLAFTNLINQLVFPLNGLAGQWASFQRSLSAVERIRTAFERPVESDHLPAYQKMSPRGTSIHFQHLSFSYDGRHPVYTDLSLTIPAGQTVAIIGPSGAGKTTLLQLLQRFFPIRSGSIKIDGVPIDQMPPDRLRSLIAYVPQDTYLFSGTIRDNLVIANPEATKEDLIRAAKAASIHDFILTLPRGYETEIGESGTRLSGGQKQRLAIARAMIKDAPILLLDEATSALDNETEQQVKDALYTAPGRRTTLIIAHRLSTVKQADLIVVMNQGRIVETGKHDELINKDGLYRELYMGQEDAKNLLHLIKIH
ncbi:ABC transporter ATP-binding protein [Sporolactobacillus sp. THM7-4]|nr:ABC transporter ATP-binding protein [Sporolactobacillus sp. THM7-4]